MVAIKAEVMDDPIATVKATVRIEDYAQNKMGLALKLRKTNEWWGCCPFHQESTPSFHIRVKEQTFKCFGCGKGGDVIDLEMAATGETNPRVAAEHILAEYGHKAVGLLEPRRIRPLLVGEPGSKDKGAVVLSRDAQDWLASRGISAEVALRNGISGRNNAIEFPYVNDGEVVNRQTRTLSAKGFRFETGKPVIPFGLDDCDGQPEVVIVEGVMDKLSVEEATGRTAVLAMPSAKPSADCFELMGVACKDAQKIIVAVDNDEPGQQLQAELIKRLGMEKVWTVTWPEGCKDANDVLVQEGDVSLLNRVLKAEPLPVAGVFSLDDGREELHDLYENGLPPGWSTGWPMLDHFYTVRPGCLTVLTGVPSSGKSVWLDALLVNLTRQGKRFALCSPEMQPTALHWARLAQLYVGKPFRQGPTPRMSRDELEWAEQHLRQHLWFVLPDEPTLDAVLERLAVAQMRYGVDGWVIDPWNDLIHPKDARESGTEYIHERLAGIKRKARNHGVHVWVVVHPTKMAPNPDGTWPVPHPYNAAGSAGWFDKPDNFLTMWRNKANPQQPVELHVQKVRWDWDGDLGVVRFDYDKPTGRYTETRLLG